MAIPTTPVAWETLSWPILAGDIPILYEDEDEGDMGEANYHVLADEILHVCLSAHFREHRPECQVFSNMNLYYLDGPPHPRTGSAPYVSPDTMVVVPYQPLAEKTTSYKIGTDGPPPLLTAEVLSQRSAQQRDLSEKMVVYQKLRVAEYILVDGTGKRLKERLLLKRLGEDGEYHDFQDTDGGVTSDLGFRLVLEPDGLRIIHAATGYRYIRPMESEQAAKAQRLAEEARLRAEAKGLLAEEKRRRAEEAQRRAEEERSRAEEERMREREARTKAEEERMREREARAKAEEDLKSAQERLRALEEELKRTKDGRECTPRPRRPEAGV